MFKNASAAVLILFGLYNSSVFGAGQNPLDKDWDMALWSESLLPTSEHEDLFWTNRASRPSVPQLEPWQLDTLQTGSIQPDVPQSEFLQSDITRHNVPQQAPTCYGVPREVIQQAIDQVLPQTVQRSLQQVVSQVFQQAPPQAIRQRVQLAVQEAVQQTFQQIMWPIIKQALPQAIERTVLQVVQQTIQTVAQQKLPQVVQQAARKAIEQGLWQVPLSALQQVSPIWFAQNGNESTTRKFFALQVDIATMRLRRTFLLGNRPRTFKWGWYVTNKQVGYLIKLNRVIFANSLQDNCSESYAEELAKKPLSSVGNFFNDTGTSDGLVAGITRTTEGYQLALQTVGIPQVVAFVFKPIGKYYTPQASTLMGERVAIGITNADLLIIVESCVAERISSGFFFEATLDSEDVIPIILKLNEEQQFILVSQIG